MGNHDIATYNLPPTETRPRSGEAVSHDQLTVGAPDEDTPISWAPQAADLVMVWCFLTFTLWDACHAAYAACQVSTWWLASHG